MTQHAQSFDWLQAIYDAPGLAYLLITVVSAGGLIFCCRALVRLRPAKQSANNTAQSGTATIEFTLVLPFLLIFSLLLLQTALAMVGKVYVHYAAFAATRAAIVQIPALLDDPLEPRNTIIPVRGGEKFDHIFAAAVWAITPVCGQLDNAAVNSNAFTDALHDMFAAQGRTSPNWVNNLAAQRLNYATEKTTVTLMRTEVFDDDVEFTELTGYTPVTFGPRDPITVRVEHQLNLSVPYVRALFADGEQQTADGPGAYTTLSAQVTLTNEGINPELPPRPTLPRRP